VQHTNRTFAGAALALAVLVTATTFVAVEAASNRKNTPNQGKVKAANLGLYWDNACTNTTVVVDWGLFSPGAASSITLYVRNEGSSAVKLNLTTRNWNPASTSKFIELTWNREGLIFEPQTVVAATLTLSVSASISEITAFSFDTTLIDLQQ
jgi:hypothetical protein